MDVTVVTKDGQVTVKHEGMQPTPEAIAARNINAQRQIDKRPLIIKNPTITGVELFDPIEDLEAQCR